MPQLVTKSRTVRSLAPGAEVVFGDEVRVVETVDHKVKWSTITYKDGLGKIRVEGDSTVMVQAMEMTEEEREAALLRRRIEGIEAMIEQAPMSVAAAKDKLMAEIDSPWTSHWAYESFIAAKESARLWAEVAKVWELAQQPEHEAKAIEAGEEPFETIIDAKAYIVRKYRGRLLENFTPTSRSTSVVSNAIEDIQREVQIKFVRDDRWF
jgi:hypothetical protein